MVGEPQVAAEPQDGRHRPTLRRRRARQRAQVVEDGRLQLGQRPVPTFGWIGTCVGMDLQATRDATRDLLGWTPTGPTLLEDVAAGPERLVDLLDAASVGRSRWWSWRFCTDE
ncbi:MAG: hypothetical protein B7X40_08815 [Cellulomonas sp. 14-74-6]|nr:MAG: hypothetical protein B7X40_08815 [Cellulomonas sp. 14-74-6]